MSRRRLLFLDVRRRRLHRLTALGVCLAIFMAAAACAAYLGGHA